MPLPPLPEPQSLIARLLGFIKGFTAATILFGMLLFINLLQMLSMIIKPIAPGLFRRFNRECANFWWSAGYLWAERLYDIHVTISGDDPPPKENVLLISNHQEMPDIPVLFKLAYNKQRLGDIKWFVKHALKYIPGVGWGMVFLDCLFVKRNWAADKDSINRIFSNIIDNKIPVWIISFAEGTRIKPKKLEKSNEYAEKKGLATTNHVLLPRTKGVTATVTGLRTHLDAVYDVTIGYVDGVPTIWQWFKGYTKQAYLHVERFPIDDIPQTEDELSEWITQRFYLKDARMAHFYQTGSFEGFDASVASGE
jgi:1-acyl-sn-glycerol-3-phosphate acyltransferase